MTLRQFNFVMFALIATMAAFRHDWFGATGWSSAALLQFDIVMNELEAKDGKSRQ